MHWKQPIYEALFLRLSSPINASLLYAVVYTLLHLAIAYILYRRNIFLRV
jgi:predicted acyltransferase